MRKQLLFCPLLIFTMLAAGKAVGRTIDLSLCERKASISQEVVAKVNEYADLLARTGQQAEASRVQQDAARLANAGRGASTSIGFNPQQLLNAYAVALRKARQPDRAGQMRALGQQMHDANMACYYIQLQRTPR